MNTPQTLVITRHYYPEPTGSAPPMQQLAEWLGRNGGQTKVVTSRPSYPATRVFKGYAKGEHDHEFVNGVEILRWSTMAVRRASLLYRVAPEFRFLLQLWRARLTGQVKPSAQLISLCPSIFTVIGALAFRACGGRHVALVHDIQSGLGRALGSPVVRVLMRALQALEGWALNRVDHIVVLSDSMADAIRAIGVTKPITVLPPQIDCSAIFPQQRPQGAPPTLMYSGNLGRKQGLQQILDLAALLKVRAPEVRIVMRGGGALTGEIEAGIRDANLTNVELLPLVAQEDIAASMAEGDVHLVPQIAEGGDFAVPSKAFAIMAAGRPFIATGTPGSAIDLLARESQSCVCVPPFDAEAFADAALKLLGNEKERARLGAAGRNFVLGHADTNVVMSRMFDLLTDPQAQSASIASSLAAPPLADVLKSAKY